MGSISISVSKSISINVYFIFIVHLMHTLKRCYATQIIFSISSDIYVYNLWIQYTKNIQIKLLLLLIIQLKAK